MSQLNVAKKMSQLNVATKRLAYGFGVAAAAGAAAYYKDKDSFQQLVISKVEEKKVLVIPFHRIELKDRESNRFPLDPRSIGGEIIRLEVKELVDIIHHAASDPHIVALYGTFGHGSVLPRTGWADLEEIRNALKVFRESHRTHYEPNLHPDPDLKNNYKATREKKYSEKKPLYCYADNFGALGDPGNKDYYVASAFTHVHMQEKGELNLFGMLSEHIFIKGLLEKYGVKLHVSRHGQYKNAPNMFTEIGFTKAHRENVRSILDSMNADVCADISSSRKLLLPDKHLCIIWDRIHEIGSFPAITARRGGFIDYLPRCDPLRALLNSNIDPKSQGRVTQDTDFDGFKGIEAVSLKSYAKKVQNLEGSEWFNNLFLKTKKEKIALLYIQGSIDDKKTIETVNAIRSISRDKDTKCVVVRVSSPGGTVHACETISQELQDLDLPVIVSHGNVAASGGYYVSAMANRVFASNKTLTGSIGVFGIRADLSGLLSQYGIKSAYEASGSSSAIAAPFHPMTNKMRKIFADSVERSYEQFKSVVSSGRELSLDYVECIAQGRVWTGKQAKRIGLVDEIGGLHRALVYARRNFVETEEVDVVVWPKKQSFFQLFQEIMNAGTVLSVSHLHELWLRVAQETMDQPESRSALYSTELEQVLHQLSLGGPRTVSGLFYSIDEDSALRSLTNIFAEHSKEKRWS